MARAPIDALLAALADPTRRAIVARLAKGDANVQELQRPFRVSQPAISKHLRLLEEAGLIARGRLGQTRPCRLEPGALAQLSEWVDEQRALWARRTDRLEGFAQDGAGGKRAASGRRGSAGPVKSARVPKAARTAGKR